MEFELCGNIKDGYEKVGQAFMTNFYEHRELGAAAAVVVDEELVVDIWGGYKDEENTPWEENTLVNVWSTTKGLTSLAAHILISRGLLDIDKPVADYWPEFGAAGKAEIPVRYFLNHRSGMAVWQKEIPVDVLFDWEEATRLLAEQEPVWKPGEVSGYHLLTYGFLIGEVIRRIDSRPVEQFIQEEIVAPLGLDFHMPIAESEWDKISDVVMMPVRSKGSQQFREKLSELASFAFTNPLARIYDANSANWRSAVIPAANGHCTARDVAKMYGVLSVGGSSKEVSLVKPQDVELMREPAPSNVDLVLGAGMGNAELIWGLGYRINHDLSYGPNPQAFYHGGFGGSLGFCDPERNFGFGYVMNRMDLSSRSGRRASNILDALYECL